MSVRHDAAAHRFVLPTDGGEGYLAYETLADGTLDLQHTVVPEEARGGGAGAALVEAAATYAREHGVKVVPTCPFAEAWFERHADARDVLASGGNDTDV